MIGEIRRLELIKVAHDTELGLYVMNNITIIIIVSVAVALIYVFIIKPRQDKKAAEAQKNQADADASNANDTHGVMQNEPLAKNEQKEKINASVDLFAPDLATTRSVVWMAHCINLPFLPQDKNMAINMAIMSMLGDFEKAENIIRDHIQHLNGSPKVKNFFMMVQYSREGRFLERVEKDPDDLDAPQYVQKLE